MSTAQKTAPANNQQRPARELHEGEALLNAALEDATLRLETTARRYVDEIDNAESRLRKCILTARGIEDLRALLSGDVMKLILRVQNQRLGFLTDKKEGYAENVVRDCVIEALLKGVAPFNNEFNIIGGNMMIVQAGWRRKLHELPGLDEFPSIQPGDVEATPKYYRIPCTAAWVYNGKPGSLSRNIFVARDTTERQGRNGGTYTKDDFTTIDNLMGKVERKMLEAIFKKIMGEPFGSLDSDTDAEPVTAEQVLGPLPETAKEPAKPAAPPVDTLAAREAVDKRCIAAYGAAFKLGRINDAQFAELLKTTYKAKSRNHLDLPQLTKLAEHLEGLAKTATPDREPGDEGDEAPSGQMFPDETPEANAERR